MGKEREERMGEREKNKGIGRGRNVKGVPSEILTGFVLWFAVQHISNITHTTQTLCYVPQLSRYSTYDPSMQQCTSQGLHI